MKRLLEGKTPLDEGAEAGDSTGVANAIATPVGIGGGSGSDSTTDNNLTPFSTGNPSWEHIYLAVSMGGIWIP